MITRGQHLASLLTPAAILLGCAALAARPPATSTALVVLVAVGAIGVLAPLPPWRLDARTDARGSLAVIGLGVVAFALARTIAAPLPAPVTLFVLGATVLAAVAEEIFFRRLAYGWLARAGDPVALVGAAALFAIVHLPAYGPRVLPLDLAAGLLFGWQRWATGGWIAPALTHAAANVMQLW